MTDASTKAIVFDLGNVLLEFDFQLAATNLARHAEASPGMILKEINQTPLLHAFERGQISQQHFFETVAETCSYREDFNTFCNDFSDIFSEIEPMVAFHRSLKEKSIQTAIFSNTNEMAVGYIRKNFSFLKEFDTLCLSYEHGAMKPDLSIYHTVESLLGREPGKLCFIDDRRENVEAANSLGWYGLIHKDPCQTVEAVQGWLGS
jgi:epoxide hydrolase-like predicted phosphatase